MNLKHPLSVCIKKTVSFEDKFRIRGFSIDNLVISGFCHRFEYLDRTYCCRGNPKETSSQDEIARKILTDELSRFGCEYLAHIREYNDHEEVLQPVSVHKTRNLPPLYIFSYRGIVIYDPKVSRAKAVNGCV